MKIKKNFLRFLIVILFSCSVAFTYRQAKAGVPLLPFIYYGVTAATGAFLFFCDIHDCFPKITLPPPLPLTATLSGGDTWVGSVASSVSANSVLIGDAAVKYQIPLDLNTPIPPVIAPITSSSEVLPVNYSPIGVKPIMDASSNCVARGSSVDGLAHNIPVKIYSSFSEMASVCDSLRIQFAKAGAYKDSITISDPLISYGSGYSAEDLGLNDIPIESSPYHIQASLYCPGFEIDKRNDSCINAALAVEFSLIETSDNIKRFKRDSLGFKPDSFDPDWTKAELDKYIESRPVQIPSDDGHLITNASIEAGKTKIESAVQVGTSVRYRVVEVFNGVTVAASDSVLENSNPGSVLPASGTGTGSSTGPIGSTSDPLNVKFPDDYSRQGTAAATQANTQSIANSLKDTTDASEPTVAPTSDFDNSFFNKTFDNLLEWTPPQHVSTCPTSSFNALGQTFTIDAHCELMEDNKGPLQTAMSVIYLIMSLFIVLKA